MPTKNRVKTYIPDAYYHVYSRGVNKRVIFIDDSDYSVFLNLLKRYLSKEVSKDRYKRVYENMSNKVEVLAYCLMPNHFHLLLYQKSEQGMPDLLQRILTSYSMYFNKKYRRSGQLFQDAYKAKHISSDEYLEHISRYIHLNHSNWRRWGFSSLGCYLNEKQVDWLSPESILGLFKDKNDYLDFVSDYVDYKNSLDTIKAELADR